MASIRLTCVFHRRLREEDPLGDLGVGEAAGDELEHPAAIAAAAVLGVGGVLQLVDEQSSESTVVGVEHVILASLTASLVLLVPLVLLLARIAGRPRLAVVPVIGMTALAVLSTISNVRGEDPSFFAAVAVPSNLLWFAGYVALAVALKRSRRVPGALVVGLPVTWILSLPLSPVGGGIVAGAYWLVVGWLLQHEQLSLPAREPAPATA